MVDITLSREVGRTCSLDLRENSVNYEVQLDVQRRNFMMSDSCYGYYYAGPQHFTQRIDNACLRHQVFLTHSGRGRILLDGQEYIAEPDTVALMNLAHAHRYETLGDHWDYEWVNFTAPCCAYYESQINPNGFTIYDLHGNARIPGLVQEIRAGVMQAGLHESVTVTVRCLDLLDAFCAMATAYQQQQLPNCTQNVLATIQYIDEHYMEDITLDQLAEMAFLSKFYYTRIFTSQKGMTPYKYLTNVRLNHARSLMLSTSLSIDKIGWQVGYGGSRNLIRAFKQATGVTPDKYRRTLGAP